MAVSAAASPGLHHHPGQPAHLRFLTDHTLSRRRTFHQHIERHARSRPGCAPLMGAPINRISAIATRSSGCSG
jgi:hypothetical protein